MTQFASTPFDSTADQYDATFSDTQLAAWLRDLVHHHLPFQSGQSVLELGCGTGIDALRLANRSVKVLATDVSAEMVNITNQKAEHAQITGCIETQQLDLNNLSDIVGQFDGVLANFGVLNCVQDRQQLAIYLARHTRRDSRLVFVIMGPVCLWEMGWYLLHGQLAQATRRLRGRIPAHVGDGRTILVDYPPTHQLCREFAPYFRMTKSVGIGGFLPPSYLNHLVERYPSTFHRFAKLDFQLATTSLWPQISDHYLIEFERI